MPAAAADPAAAARPATGKSRPTQREPGAWLPRERRRRRRPGRSSSTGTAGRDATGRGQRRTASTRAVARTVTGPAGAGARRAGGSRYPPGAARSPTRRGSRREQRPQLGAAAAERQPVRPRARRPARAVQAPVPGHGVHPAGLVHRQRHHPADRAGLASRSARSSPCRSATSPSSSAPSRFTGAAASSPSSARPARSSPRCSSPAPAARRSAPTSAARKIREEIDAMEVLGICPIQRLVVPRVLADDARRRSAQRPGLRRRRDRRLLLQRRSCRAARPAPTSPRSPPSPSCPTSTSASSRRVIFGVIAAHRRRPTRA